MTAKTIKPLKGHPFHKRTDDELLYIFRDASEAALAMSGHDTVAEAKYLDQANDAATIYHWRRNYSRGSYVPNEVLVETIPDEHHGDWHDRPLRYAVYGTNGECQKFATQKDAHTYARLRRRTETQDEAVNAFVKG